MIGQLISHYRIIEKISEGGMGIVYKAEDIQLDRIVALKFLPFNISRNLSDKKRFINEAKALATLNHPNVATIYAIEEYDEKSFIVMEFVEGKDLRKLLTKDELKKLTIEKIINFTNQIVEGLQAAHNKQITHRDIKPENIIVNSNEQVKILDFGLAKIKGKELVTMIDTTMGTIAYMSPEQTRGEVVDHRTDIWSVGVMLYEMLTGNRPFRGEYEQAIIYSILNENPEPLHVNYPDITKKLEKIVFKSLAKKPADRYNDCEELLSDLKSCLLPVDKNQEVKDKRKIPDKEKGKFSSSKHQRNLVWYLKSIKKQLKISWRLILAIVILFAVGIYIFYPRIQNDESSEKRIAVLPFINLSNDPNDEYFSDGITDDILTYLYKIGDLQVISRTTMRQYKETNKSIREIGNELNVSAILEGSVRRTGNKLHLVAQLIDAETDDHLWAEVYDREIEDVFNVQTEIAKKIAEALHSKLSPIELSKLTTPAITNINAYNLQLEGEYYLLKGNSENVLKAIEKFNQTLSVDSSISRTWAYLATAYARLADLGAISTDEGYSKARYAASKAILLDDNYAQGHTIMGWIKRSYDWDWVGAEDECRKALVLAPGDATVIRNLANLEKSLGRFEEAIELIKKAVALDPKRIPTYTSLGLFSMYANRLNDAEEAYQKAIELNSEYPIAHTFLGLVYVLQRKPEKAITTIQKEVDEGWRLYGLAQAFYSAGQFAESDSVLGLLITNYGEESSYQIAQVFAFRGDANLAFKWLEKAYASRDGGLSELKGDPFMKKIEKDLRFIDFIRRMKLPV